MEHGLDAEPGGRLRGAYVDLPAVEQQASAVRKLDPGDDLHQRGLAGPVVADQPHHLAAAHLQVGAAKGAYRAEALDDAFGPQMGRGPGRAGPGPPLVLHEVYDRQNAVLAASPLQTSDRLIEESFSITYRTPSSPIAL